LERLMASSSQLAERVLDCFPSGSYALAALLQLLEIVESTEVETAAVECRLEPRMIINPSFVETWAATPEQLLMLVMHELHHVLLGHTRLFPRVTHVDNLVFDAVINALLCRMFPEPEFTSFFTNFYDDASFPACLLRPPAGWRPDEEAAIPPALAGDERYPLAEVYQALYSPAGVGYDELYAIFRASLAAGEIDVILIGDHGDGSDTSSSGDLQERSPLLFDIVRSIVERWPQPPDPIAGRSLAEMLREEQVRPARIVSNRSVLGRLLRRVGGTAAAGHLNRSVHDDTMQITQPVFARDRTAAIRAALGMSTLLYQHALPHPRLTRAGERVHVYLDVSGSIGTMKGALYAAVLDCHGIVHPSIHLFSTRIASITLAQLRRGECHTTGGTDISCVAQHMRENRVRRAAIITDGWVGRPKGEDALTLGEATIGVALTPDNATRSDLEAVTNFWAQLGECGGRS
jgi:hypothetical protein